QPGYTPAPTFGVPGAQPFGMQRPFGSGKPPEDTDDLGSTVALPVNNKAEQERQRASGVPFGAYNQSPGGAQGYPQPPNPGFNGQGVAPQAPHFGQFNPQGKPGQPPFSNASAGSQSAPQLPPLPNNAPQSQIETALSLPRPDPAALWLAQQEKQRGERRSIGLFVAVVAVTAVCVIGIALLLYNKLRVPPAQASTIDAPPLTAIRRAHISTPVTH